MPDKLKISYPHMGDYHVPVCRLLTDLFPEAEVVPAPPITQKTVEVGSLHSPDFVCSPFKYNMGNYIEALDAGANVLLQTGLGCRYGYYGEVQEQILRDMGYDFTFLCFSRQRAHPHVIFETCRKLNPALTLPAFLRAVLLTLERIRIMDDLDFFLREHVGFETESGSFANAKKAFLTELVRADSLPALQRLHRKYRRRYQSIPTQVPNDPLRVGIVGELYTLMEPFSNHFLERKLARGGIVVSREMSATFLLFGKHDRHSLRIARGYLRHTVGANGIDSVAQSRRYAEAGYDGLLHIKSFGCTPELNAQPALEKLSRDFGIPILHLSFDTQTGEAGLQTRIEAFMDMLEMMRGKKHEKTSQSWGGHRLHLHQGRFHG